ncbi:Hed1p [Lachancea thermotolerans CBS 6340]|uniref:KLTH0C08250p n=1 Tax=Lachancea thermotolerans (strain ATCC 56472 / CBS 6340 / NRRL Y-8284) TaxID=559295 RepID=C5DED2_LACTC|nr:KLTH0C08250p [Lachancea thermotolerans CBS 6340]CAR22143.1 KLTH0C08250p [Lachancea thermotolerans CBS 6340]
MSSRRSRTVGVVPHGISFAHYRPNTVHLDNLDAERSFEELQADVSLEAEESSIVRVSQDSSFQQLRGGRSLTEAKVSSNNHPELKRSQTACIPLQNSEYDSGYFGHDFERSLRAVDESRQTSAASISDLCEIETGLQCERSSSESDNRLSEGYVAICHVESAPCALGSAASGAHGCGIAGSPPCQQGTGVKPGSQPAPGSQQVTEPSSSDVLEPLGSPGDEIVLCDSRLQQNEISAAKLHTVITPMLPLDGVPSPTQAEPNSVLSCQRSVLQSPDVSVHKPLRDLINKTNHACYRTDSSKVRYKAGLSRKSSKLIPHLHDKFNK